jgi:hypothetical protein
MLTFSFHNQKINELARHLGLHKNQVVAFDLPAGYTCPMAHLCRTYANRKTGLIIKGIESQFRCYAASVEGRYPAVRRLRWRNYEQLQGLSLHDTIALIDESLPSNLRVVRIHSSGDFFSENYFRAWYEVAYNHPETVFFGYTKILDYVHFALKMDLHNFKLVYSHGGKHDNFITNEPVAYVVNGIADANKIGVPISCADNPADDYDYIIAGESFALNLHGNQPKGTYA